MAKKLSSVVGIDIGSQKIKVCEVRTQGREPVVTALGIADTPEGAVDHTGIFNPEAVGAALKQLLAQSGAQSPSAVVSIAGQASVLVRILEVPKMTPNELKDHMQWEINRNIPFAESTIVSDYKPIGGVEDPNAQNMEVVMAIAPQSAIDTMLVAMKKAGKAPAAIDVEPLSIARSLARTYDEDLSTKTFCVVDIGHKTTSINIYRGDKLAMPRQVPLGGEMFTKAIADDFMVPMEEAERMKIERLDIPENAGALQAAADPFGIPTGTTQEFQPYNPFADTPTPAQPYNPFADLDVPTGAAPVADPMDPFAAPPVGDDETIPPPVDPFASAPPPAASDPTPATVGDPEAMRLFGATAPLLEELSSEIRRSVDYFRSRGGEVDMVVLCGGGSKMRGLTAFLSRSLGIACDAYDPLRRLNVNAKKLAPEFVDEHRQELAVAVGNGLHIFFD